ncbi:MAG: hypothetical protein HOD58_04425 [Gammaproteobacteria bacterium]|nr:hypothetical protein [Gammaproteobacteria bacterium]
MNYSNQTLYIIKKLDALNGALDNVKRHRGNTDTAKSIHFTLVKHLNRERQRLIEKLESMASDNTVNIAGNTARAVSRPSA